MAYTARIAPAQLGKAIPNRYSSPAVIGSACFPELDLSADMSIHASTFFLIPEKSLMTGCAATELQLPASCKRTVNAR